MIEWGTKQEEKKERVNILIDEWPIIELARIGYKSSGISVYLPKRVSKALRLDKGTINRSLLWPIDLIASY